MSEWIAAWWERLLFTLVGWTQCKESYDIGVFDKPGWCRMYCVKHKWHIGGHLDNCGEWLLPAPPPDQQQEGGS